MVDIDFTYVAVLKVVKEVVGHAVDAVNLLEVEDRVSSFTAHRRHTVDGLWLVLEDVGHESVLAEVSRQTIALVDLHAEEDLLVKQLARIIYKQVIIRLTIAINITGPV